MFIIHKVFQRFLLCTLLSLFIRPFAFAQDCGCDFTFKASDAATSGTTKIDGKGNFSNIRPGNVLCIEAGLYEGGLQFVNLIGGSGSPIVIKNCGGQVALNESIQIFASRYVKISGTGDASKKYGFKVQKSAGVGVDIGQLSSDVEVENIEIENAGFAGIMAKTDPQCNKPETWKDNFTLYNLKIHDCFIHDTEGEGMYIGATAGYKDSNKWCNGGKMYAHYLKSVYIYNNRLERTGWDGIQVNLAVEDTKIYNNTVIGYGTSKTLYQNFGFSIGSGTKGRIYSNFIYQLDAYKTTSTNPNDYKASGVQIISNQDTFFYNNIIVNSERHGVFAHNRLTPSQVNSGEGYYFINNTIIGSGLSGIFYTSASGVYPYEENNNWRRIFYNNLIVAPRSKYESENFWKGVAENYIDFNSVAMRDDSKDFKQNNIFATTIDEVHFANAKNPIADANNFKLTETSQAVDAGRDAATSFGVNSDYSGFSRQPTTFDIGAFEYRENDPVGLNPQTDATISNLYPNPSFGKINFEVNFKRKAYGVIKLLSLDGKQAAQVFAGNVQAGSRSFAWNNTTQLKGLYILHISAGKQHVSKHVVLK